MVIRVRITEKNIREGVPGDAETCPIALALSRYIVDDVSVDACSVDLGEHSFEATPAIAAFVNRFDAGHNVSPFSFSLEVPKYKVRRLYW